MTAQGSVRKERTHMRMQPARTAPTVIAPRIQANLWIVLLVLTLGYFMILLDTSIVNVALPDMERGLHAGFDQILWVVNGYVLVYAVLLITAGRLGDLFGPKRLFIAGLALFTLASAACGLAQDAGQLILFRFVQGAGGAIMTPQTLAILPSLFPPERRGAAFGLLGSVAGLAVVVGPTLGGWLVTAASWQAIFFVNVPVGLVAALAAALLLPEVRSHRAPALDLPGVALASGGLCALIYALVESQKYSWGPINAGLTMIPTSLGIMVASPLSGRLSDRLNGKYTLLAGLVAAALGIGLTTSALALSNTSWDLVLPLAITGLGMGFVFAPLNTLAMRDVHAVLAGAASGVLFTNRQVGQAMGSAVIGSVLANGVATALPRQAAQLAAQVPPAFRGHFVSAFERASHGAQNFGVGQTHGTALPPDTPSTVV